LSTGSAQKWALQGGKKSVTAFFSTKSHPKFLTKKHMIWGNFLGQPLHIFLCGILPATHE
jgi:hypothetical protein